MTKALLFDFDGTLVDSAPGIVATMEQTFLQMGLCVPPRERMVATIGIPLRLALKQLNDLSDSDADRATSLYRDLFPSYEAELVQLFPNVITSLKDLQRRGLRMALVTSRDHFSLDLIAGRMGLLPFFEDCMTGVDGFPPKPAPDMAKALLDRMGLDAHEALVVGDTSFDIEMGNAAGCKTVAVTYGNHSRQQLLSAHPTHIIDSFEQILTLICYDTDTHNGESALHQA